MRRTDTEFKAEVLRRAEQYRAIRRKRRKTVLLACLPLLLCCGGLMAVFSMGYGGSTMGVAYDSAKSAEYAEAPAAAAPESVEEEYAMQSVMDSASESMPEDFAIRFSWAIGAENIYDTYTGQLQKDLVLDGVATADFEPDREVLEQIYRKVTELNLVSINREMTSASLTKNDEMVAMTPLTVYKIQFTINGTIYSITGDATASCYPEDQEAARFMEFVEFMREVMGNTPEYKQMPKHNGGYD